MKQTKFLSLATFFLCLNVFAFSQNPSSENSIDKIQVLNFGTFHMSYTNDANKTEFDENDKENQKAVHKIAEMLSTFKPTVIIVEYPPSYNAKLQQEYSDYIKNPSMHFESPSEVELLAFEIGRLSNTARIYGIDNKMSYNYNIGFEILNTIDSLAHNQFYSDPSLSFPILANDENKLSVLEKLKNRNSNEYLDFLITVNADMLTHAGTDGNFEGADEAARYYQRNLRMYSNLNRISLDKNDRVFILMGASHTAFFRDFISRSPKYKMVDTDKYLSLD